MRTLVFLILTVFFLNSFGQKMPKESPLDSRIQKMAYNENDVVEIHAAIGVATQIVFEEGEDIIDIATGFTQGWELKKRQNHLYLKPKSFYQKDAAGKVKLQMPRAEFWNTNLIITTHLRTYSFELILEEKKSLKNVPNKIAYRITFQYPLEDQKKNLVALKEQEIEKRLESQPIPLNWNYTMKVRRDSASIAPSQAFDDGRFTYLTFPANQEFPSVFMVEENKKESLVNTHINPKQPDVLVIQRVAPAFMLRSGKKVIGVFNEGKNIYQTSHQTNTIVPSVQRVVQQ